MKRWYQRPVALLSVLALALILTLFTSAWVHDTNLERRFNSVKVGMTEQQVIALIGQPEADEQCGSLGGFPASCSHELRYQPKAPTVTSYVVFLDSRGSVVGKYVYQSP
jgi:hypothetical protein